MYACHVADRMVSTRVRIGVFADENTARGWLEVWAKAGVEP